MGVCWSRGRQSDIYLSMLKNGLNLVLAHSEMTTCRINKGGANGIRLLRRHSIYNVRLRNNSNGIS